VVGFVAEVQEQDDGDNIHCPGAACHFCSGYGYEIENEDADGDYAAGKV